jgi:hypothetical protein
MAQGLLKITPRELCATVGDTWAHKVTLWEDGAVKDVSAATDISVALQDHTGSAVISATACSSGATGASWSTGVVVLPFTATQTAALATRSDNYRLELQVTIGGAKMTWPMPMVRVQNGVI